MIFYVFIIVFITFVVLFSQQVRRKNSSFPSDNSDNHRHRKRKEGDRDKDSNKEDDNDNIEKKRKRRKGENSPNHNINTLWTFLETSIERIWVLLTMIFLQVDIIINRYILKYTASNDAIRSLVNSIDLALRINCSPTTGLSLSSSTSTSPPSSSSSSSDSESLQAEIDSFIETVYDRYITSWHSKLDIQTTKVIQEHDFKATIKRYMKDVFVNFYNDCKANVSVEELLTKFCYYLEDVSLEKTETRTPQEELTYQGQVSFMLDSLDALAKKIVPKEILDVLLKCQCCHKTGKSAPNIRQCLEHSDNPFRLFVYNLIIHGLFIPLIDRISRPQYIIYQLIYLLSTFDDSLSFEEFFKTGSKTDPIGIDSYEAEVIENAMNAFENSQNSSENFTDLAEEALEDISKDSTIFFNIKIVDVRISHSSSQKEQFVDYIVVFNVLECDDSLLSPKTRDQIPLVRRTYQIKRRFREFMELQHKLEKSDKFKDCFGRIKNKPSIIQLSSETILDRFRLKRITEDSSIVQFRKPYLEAFLTNLGTTYPINESNIFSDFLGYSYAKVRTVQSVLYSGDELERRLSSSAGDFRGIAKVKGFLKIFMPLQAKVGRLTTQIDDVVVNESVSQKYSITKIEMFSRDHDEMLLKARLDQWFDRHISNTKKDKRRDDSLPILHHTNYSSKISFKDIITSVLNAIFKTDSSWLIHYFASKIDLSLDYVQLIYRRVWVVDRFWAYWCHRWHRLLQGEQPAIDEQTMTYEEFLLLTENLTVDELFERFCDLYSRPISRFTARRVDTRIGLWILSYFHSPTTILSNIRDLFSSHERNKYYCYLILDLFVKQFTK